MKSYMTQKATFGEKDKAKEIKVGYLVIDAPASYNMIIGRPPFNQMGSTLSTLYLCIKYRLFDRRVGVIQGDQEISRKYSVESLKMKRICILGMNTRKVGLDIKSPIKVHTCKKATLKLTKGFKIKSLRGMTYYYFFISFNII